jgi:hypothetical protein
MSLHTLSAGHEAVAPVGAEFVHPPSWRLQPGVTLKPGFPQLVAILDTNALANACCLEARSGNMSLPSRLMETGRVQCFIADHVQDELREHLERIVTRRGVSFDDAWDVWRNRIGPLMRVVELPIGEYLRPEIALIRDPDRGDHDDWPTLALAAFLGPSLIVSNDHVFPDLGFAAPSANWTNGIKALHQAATIEGRWIDGMAGTMITTRALWAGGRGLVGMIQRWPWLLPFALLGAGTSAIRGYQGRRHLREAVRDAGEALGPFIRAAFATVVEFEELRSSLITVEDPPWRTETLAERCARLLARTGDPMTPMQMRDAIRTFVGERVSGAGIKRAIAQHPSFTRISGDFYQIGR